MDDKTRVNYILLCLPHISEDNFEIFLLFIRIYLDRSNSNTESLRSEFFDLFDQSPDLFDQSPSFEDVMFSWLEVNSFNSKTIPNTLLEIVNYVSFEVFSNKELASRFFPEIDYR